MTATVVVAAVVAFVVVVVEEVLQMLLRGPGGAIVVAESVGNVEGCWTLEAEFCHLDHLICNHFPICQMRVVVVAAAADRLCNLRGFPRGCTANR